MIKPGSAVASIDEAIANLRSAGYRVLAGAETASVAPEWLRPFRPDFIAQRDDEFLVVEAKRRSQAAASPELVHLEQLASEIGKHPGWALELVWLGDEDISSTATDVANLIARAERVLEVDVEAALLLVWPAVETSLQLLASRVGARDVPARQLMSELYSLGWLSERHFNELDAAQSVRNTLAHRAGKGQQVNAAVVLRLAELATRLSDPQYVAVDQMVEWFHENYMDPASGVPYNSREGGYLYVNGGPYDALQVLTERFPDALGDELEDAAALLAGESSEWVRHDEY
ncbi:hypothetical protein KQI48_12280 [Cellulomonas hominis]|uniref:hypothetical protein n=1 Tax=Cellulomonas hominis TaxID=156981 RepID=UPI001C119E1F|nr:hypothetical protein [Cellulomonas hominis]MBU5423443.1 hypothetical protein [Cellulomonas hominis]